jgi:hypothetical protein
MVLFLIDLSEELRRGRERGVLLGVLHTIYFVLARGEVERFILFSQFFLNLSAVVRYTMVKYRPKADVELVNKYRGRNFFEQHTKLRTAPWPTATWKYKPDISESSKL